jgi:hypothetical protein
MDTMNSIYGSGKGSESFRAHVTPKFLPDLGSGVKLFDAPMRAAGNSRVRVQGNQGGFSAVA